jgi:hypothetical protein
MDTMITLHPTDKEFRALRLHVCTNETRVPFCHLFGYASEGGLTYMATDGHTMIVRRSGTHRTMSPADIDRLEPMTCDEDDVLHETAIKPPGWSSLLKPGSRGELAPAYGFAPEYIARIGDVERAAGARAAEDYVPRARMSIKDQKKARADLKTSPCARWIVPSDPLDGWYWSINTDAALWEGVVMPRRI